MDNMTLFFNHSIKAGSGDDSEYKDLYLAEKQKADTAETEVERLEGELEPLRENKQALIDLIERNFTEFVIPEGVTKIGNNIFNGCVNLTDVTIPESVTSIGGNVFRCCTNLQSLIIPDTITSIGDSVFYESGIVTLEIPDSVLTVGFTVCCHCQNLTSVKLSSNMQHIEAGSFGNCQKLEKIEFLKGLTYIHTGAFNGCTSLRDVTFEQGFNASINLSASTLYSVETMVSWFEALADLTGQTAKTLTIGSTNLAKMTLDQQDIAFSKNWVLK